MNSNYLVNSREYTSQFALEEELTFKSAKNYLFELDYLSCLNVIGEKATDFLQGQLSCDLRLVNQNNIQQGVLCNLKGRILALMDVIDWGGLKLILPADLINDTEAALAKAAMLAKVRLEKNNDYHVFGFYYQGNQAMLPPHFEPLEPYAMKSAENISYYCLDPHFYIFLLKNNQTSSFKEAFQQEKQLRGSLAWHYLQLKNNRVEIYPESRGLFLPHRLNLHKLGYLNFAKGCYKGQEIIARMHYKATLKHGLQQTTIQTTEPLLVGQKMYDSTNQIELGELVDFTPLGHANYLVAASLLLEYPHK